jgi:glycogen synthase
MHICLVSREYPPFFGGGIGTYARQFSRALAAAGHRVVVVTVGADSAEEREQDGEVTVIRFPLVRGEDWSRPHPSIDTPEMRAAFNTFAGVSVFAMQVGQALPRLHAEFAFDVVETPDTGALGWFALAERRTAGIWAADGPAFTSCIHSPTDWIAHFNRTPLRHRQDLELVEMEHDSLRWSDALVCPSIAVARWAEQRCGLAEGAVDVIPYCLGELEAVARARLSEAMPDGAGAALGAPFRVLFASRLEPRKGVDTLLAGLVRAVERGADVHLDLAGQDMPHPSGRGLFGASSLQSLVPAELRDRVTFHGKLKPERIAAMQAEAQAVAIPSPMDNFPFACMEAMAQGRVVIAARAGGMEQMIESGRSGILFEPGNAQSCAEALHAATMMTRREAWELGLGAAGRILEICGNDTIVARRVEHFRAAIERRARTLAQVRGRARQVVMVNARGLNHAMRARLERAVALGDCDFAHGWLRLDSGEIAALSNPGLESPALVHAPAGYPGAMALAVDVAGHPSVARLLSTAGPESERVCGDGAGLVRSLCEAGFTGAVVPAVISASATTPVAPAGAQPGAAEPMFAVKALRAILRTVRR